MAEVQDRSNSSALAMELLQSGTNVSTYCSLVMSYDIIELGQYWSGFPELLGLIPCEMMWNLLWNIININ